MSIQNLNTFDPFADAARGTDEGVQDALVHIRMGCCVASWTGIHNGSIQLSLICQKGRMVATPKPGQVDSVITVKGGFRWVDVRRSYIQIQQRNGRKTLTTVQGLSSDYDLKKIVRTCKKEFACNGTVVEHPEYGEVLQLQGDQRENICQFLTKVGLVKVEQIKVHGF